MANIWEEDISILAGNLNSGLSYLTKTVSGTRRQLKKIPRDSLHSIQYTDSVNVVVHLGSGYKKGGLAKIPFRIHILCVY